MLSLKRILDIALSFAGLIILIPVGSVIAILIRIDSPGGVIFSQQRLGKNGKLFKIHKFRKFPNDWGTKGSGVTTQGDVRMTAFGAFLERTKLDELPQLWNIFIGEMSFVGPRPESTRYQDMFDGEFKALLTFTPGIFGPNQVAFRNESQMYPLDQDPDEFYRTELFPKKARIDIDYFSKATVLSDIKWMVISTIGTVAGVFDWKRVYRRYAGILFVDLILFEVAWFAAHLFRFAGFNLSDANHAVYITGCWLIPLIVLPLMLVGGCYRHPMRYFGLRDVVRLSIVVTASWLVAVFIQFGFFQRNLSIGIAILGLFLFLASLVLLRVSRREVWLRGHPLPNIEQRNVLIYGAGRRGSALAKFLDQGFSNVNLVGFLDEDPDLRSRYINGLKVLGSWRDRDSLLNRYTVSELWISEYSDSADEVEIENWSNDMGLKFVFIERF